MTTFRELVSNRLMLEETYAEWLTRLRRENAESERQLAQSREEQGQHDRDLQRRLEDE
jgi:hypothetical protein